MRRVTLSDFDHGKVIALLADIKREELLTSKSACSTPERKAARSRAESLHSLIETFQKAEVM